MRVVKLKDVKNENVVERIKEELSQQLSFSRSEDVAEQTDLTDPNMMLTRKKPKYIVINKLSPSGRMQKFLSMTPEDVQKKHKPKLKCEVALSELRMPVDTLRCTFCRVLYQRDVFIAHKKLCKGQMGKKKFGCTLCTFTDYNYESLETHIRTEHPK
ncbi:hypothetical protein JTB14_033825 [Gonioctena quinquepunctata]|nr:hypothetical protein JTB14_033825 [Gonioctena quinquepunctata]